jgi:hypothetical protein
MYYTVLFYCIRSLLLFLICQLFSIIKINMISSSLFSNFTLFHGVIPIIFQSSFFGKCYILLKFSFKNLLYKLPGLFNIISYLLLASRKYITVIKTSILFIFLSIFLLFTCLLKHTIIYGIPWLCCIIYLFINIKKEASFFQSVFISTWLAHAIGTIAYGFLNGFLSHNLYLYLFPIAILERFLFITTAIFLFYGINFFDLQLKKLIETIFKKKLILKL